MQVRDVDDEVYAALVVHASAAGMTVPELLRREMTRLARRPSIAQWLARTDRRPSTITRGEVLDALDDVRGEWPGVGR